MKTNNDLALVLIPKIKGKNSIEISDIVNEWAKSRTENEKDPALKWAKLAGVLEGNITILLDYIKEKEL